MANYIDGFVFPISRDRLADYTRLAESIAGIWKEHGALTYQEFVSDDLEREGTKSFTDLLTATSEEVIIFGWVEFSSRETRDIANKEVAADPRVPELMRLTQTEFDASRMGYAGFKSLLQSGRIR